MLRNLLQMGAIQFPSKISCILSHWWYFVDCGFGSKTIFVRQRHAQDPLCPPIFEHTSSRVLHPFAIVHASSQVSFFFHLFWAVLHQAKHFLL
jgi:hypothetical protein